MSEYKSIGKTCILCGWHDHFDYHHRDAACDAVYVADPANPIRSLFGKKAEAVIARTSGSSSDASTTADKQACPQKAECQWLHPKFAQGCKY